MRSRHVLKADSCQDLLPVVWRNRRLRDLPRGGRLPKIVGATMDNILSNGAGKNHLTELRLGAYDSCLIFFLEADAVSEPPPTSLHPVARPCPPESPFYTLPLLLGVHLSLKPHLCWTYLQWLAGLTCIGRACPCITVANQHPTLDPVPATDHLIHLLARAQDYLP